MLTKSELSRLSLDDDFDKNNLEMDTPSIVQEGLL